MGGMPTSLSLTLRCQNKSVSPSLPSIGTPTPEGVNVQLQLMTAAAGASQASVQITVPIASDTFVMGGYYAVNILDGVAPGGTSVPEPCPETAAARAPALSHQAPAVQKAPLPAK